MVKRIAALALLMVVLGSIVATAPSVISAVTGADAAEPSGAQGLTDAIHREAIGIADRSPLPVLRVVVRSYEMVGTRSYLAEVDVYRALSLSGPSHLLMGAVCWGDDPAPLLSGGPDDGSSNADEYRGSLVAGAEACKP